MNRRLPALLLASVVLWITASPAFADLRKLDPTARIALTRLRGGETAQSIRTEGRLSVSAVGELDVFVTGDVSRAQLEAAGARVRTAVPGVYTAWIPLDRVEAVAALGGVVRIEGAQIDEITNDLGAIASGAAAYRGAGPTFSGYNGAGVIVGNVDTGVDYDHQDFKNAGGLTRILKIWDQTLAGPGPAGSGFTYGTEWNSAQINALTSTAKDTHGHGTHTMGTIAGDGSATNGSSAAAFTYAGMAPMADILVVDGSTTGSFSRTQMADGINYMFQQAALAGKPCVINCSIGSQTGPKDGTDAFEQTVDALSGPGRVVVMSAGNDRGAALHAEWFPGNPNPTMSISSTSTAARVVIIRGYYEASEQLNVTITTPALNTVGPIALGGVSGGYPGPLTANGNVYLENGVTLTSTGDKQIYIELNAANGATISGTWTFTFSPVVVGAAGGEVDLFRTAMSSSMTGNFVIGNQPTEEIISGIATGVNMVAAGAYVSRQSWTDCAGGGVTFGQPADGNIAGFSSPGPTRDHRIKPDVAGPGTAIVSVKTGDVTAACATPDVDMPGLLHTANQGTSMSAPHVTGAIALLFQKYGFLTPAQVQAQLHNRALVDAFVVGFGAAPNKDFGWGKLQVGDLTDPVCTVLEPNGGDVFSVGGTYTLKWNASDVPLGVSGVDLEVSHNNGGSWSTIATNQPNTGTYNWTAIGPTTATALLRVTAKDPHGNLGIDLSNAVWTINAAPLAVGDGDGTVTEFSVKGISPNPVASRAVIEYGVPRASEVKVALFDLQGREVVTLASGLHGVGRHRVTWDGELSGGPAPAGVYFIRLTGPGVAATARFVVAN